MVYFVEVGLYYMCVGQFSSVQFSLLHHHHLMHKSFIWIEIVTKSLSIYYEMFRLGYGLDNNEIVCVYCLLYYCRNKQYDISSIE